MRSINAVMFLRKPEHAYDESQLSRNTIAFRGQMSVGAIGGFEL